MTVYPSGPGSCLQNSVRGFDSRHGLHGLDFRISFGHNICVKTDSRGGYNSFSFDTNFFKKWSPAMAYTLGFIFADGTIIDAQKSSRTCYLRIDNTDKIILEKIKLALSSNHPITSTNPKSANIRNKIFSSKPKYSLRIGSKQLFQDLLNLGLIPNKSLTISLPKIPNQYFKFFLRGYFDGDGCLNLYQPHGRNKPIVNVIFTSGSKNLLRAISIALKEKISLPIKNIYYNSHAYRLSYKQSSAMKILDFMYQNLNQSPYLIRKHNIYHQIPTFKP